jgi:hypothetical protein
MKVNPQAERFMHLITRSISRIEGANVKIYVGYKEEGRSVEAIICRGGKPGEGGEIISRWNGVGTPLDALHEAFCNYVDLYCNAGKVVEVENATLNMNMELTKLQAFFLMVIAAASTVLLVHYAIRSVIWMFGL